MTLPLHVPELAPALGRLIVPRRLGPLWVPLDDVREQLATAAMELGGAARAAAQHDDRDVVLGAVAGPRWIAAWEQAVRAAAERVSDAVDGELDLAARQVRMPRGKRRRLRLGGGERRALAARLATGGGPLAAAAHDLAGATAAARAATRADDPALATWREALVTAARRLEAAWLALEDAVQREPHRWAEEIEAVSRWRPSLWPVIVLWTPIAAALIWLALVWAGYLPAPAWLAIKLGF